ncbi:hypothetical protein EDB85DRAFT_2146959 [Lactarius pseudohatsudake]|nr:hypothetical protein EDB85DRAFT_2146959 [Lactarius pseudohatsudake]
MEVDATMEVDAAMEVDELPTLPKTTHPRKRSQKAAELAANSDSRKHKSTSPPDCQAKKGHAGSSRQLQPKPADEVVVVVVDKDKDNKDKDEDEDEEEDEDKGMDVDVGEDMDGCKYKFEQTLLLLGAGAPSPSHPPAAELSATAADCTTAVMSTTDVCLT